VRFLEATSLNTTNSIYSQQNRDFIIDCLVAQRSEYSRAKLINRWKAGITLFVAVISVIASIVDNDVISAISGLLAVALLIINKWLEKESNYHKKHAASVQQYIDVKLFSDALGVDKAIWGDIPSQNDLAESITKYNQADRNELMNWYSDYSALPVEQQVLRCQKENIRWDSELNKKYRWFNVIIFVIALFAMVVSFFAVNPSFIKVICILTWLAPLGDYCYSIFCEFNQSKKLYNKANKSFNRIECNISTNSVFIDDLVSLQYQINKKREEGFLVPDWFYKKFHRKQQKIEDQIAKTIVSQHVESSENNDPGNQTTN
jgi:hypothetical protein